ncbi:hypothetical protein niasHS_018164 [Heterodera schachtii]|uniref:Ubiquitin-like domain-containing protein n=1 Tax=Heterodera schachtii TaxID=97005 RepID=A0ABD2HPD6_HETSC
MPSSSKNIEIKVEADRKINNDPIIKTKKYNEITVRVDDDGTVKDLKKKIWEKLEKLDKKFTENVVKAFGQQPKLTLEYQGSKTDKDLLVVLNDSDILTNKGIGEGSTVHLSFDIFEIRVEPVEETLNKKFTVWVKKTDTVATVKEMIKNETKIEPKTQTLRGRSPLSTVLIDTQMMAPLIETQSTIYLAIDEFQIFVDYDNQKHPFWVHGTETVGILKKKIKTAFNIYYYKNEDSSTLEYGTVGVLDHRKLINDYGIGNGATVCFSLKKFSILVTYENKKGKHHPFIGVRESDTMKMLKQKIEIELGFKPMIQSLTYTHGKKQYPLLADDTKTLEDHGITASESAELVFSEFQICVFNDGKELRVLMKIDDTVKELKEHINDMVGIPPKKQKISIAKGGEANHRVPQDNEDILSIVEDGDVVVHVSECPAHQFEIFVQYEHRKKAITVYGTDMVENLKKEINKVIGTVPANQTLTIHTVLEDGKQIQNFGIGPSSTIYLSDVESKPRRRN